MAIRLTQVHLKEITAGQEVPLALGLGLAVVVVLLMQERLELVAHQATEVTANLLQSPELLPIPPEAGARVAEVRLTLRAVAGAAGLAHQVQQLERLALQI
jgi:hypothetical protein